ncbi:MULTISPECIES: aspartyl/asparaginyl beta-hydroxylase domain-containing protein [Marinomonas]|uniref:Aspartyl/asparaginyl beta-hydroxylase domain-containing protein n=1 Tax=Marinomonas rhodophyticola TaxID=2992803 RepID=A0ABT3KGP4_9GAMM|nr:aspartyl/asparaginyl beta-hydroxylase domain-containing protein [Marinomonas sp. KJ51-3]MCW4629713.1 aspartyl/asparaginyl beta-hydroxylase domain-containing protein [Marinomonas sp. KJ51-3]
MSKANQAIWYEIYGGRYISDDPFFFDEKDFEWTQTLKDNWHIIRDEMLALLQEHPEKLKPYFSKNLVFPPKHWKTTGFFFWNWRIHKNCRRCPKTTAILESIPNLTGGNLSILEPGANINPHQGDTNAHVKVHIGLSIPKGLPDCGFQVGDEIRGWKEGELLLFCDAHRHTAWNHSDERRLVFIIDVIRPEFAHKKQSICVNVLATSMLQLLYQNVSWLNRLPGKTHHVLHFLIRNVLRLVLPIQNKLRLL